MLEHHITSYCMLKHLGRDIKNRLLTHKPEACIYSSQKEPHFLFVSFVCLFFTFSYKDESVPRTAGKCAYLTKSSKQWSKAVCITGTNSDLKWKDNRSWCINIYSSVFLCDCWAIPTCQGSPLDSWIIHKQTKMGPTHARITRAALLIWLVS